MILMQYAFTFPASYDMQKVRERIRLIGSSFDTLPGLGFKAFLVTERGIHQALDHQYSLFYMWPAADDLIDFLTGPRFASVVSAYGRPAVPIWTSLALHQGNTDRAP